MGNHEYNTETVQKKLEELDNEVDTFIQVASEFKEMKNSAGALRERLIRQEEKIADQKNELEQMISTTKNLAISIEEQTKGVIFDLEKKAESLISEVRSGLSQIGNICEKGSAQLQEQRYDQVEDLSENYREMQKAVEILKIMVDSHEERINSQNNSNSAAAGVFEKMEASLTELKKAVYETQKKPYEIDNKLKKLEEKLELTINEKNSRQKNFTLVVLIILITAIFLSVMGYYLSL